MKTRALNLTKKLLLIGLVYTVLRLLFFFYNFDQYSKFSSLQIFSAFLYGLRFDIAALLLLNAPIILLSLIPFKKYHEALSRRLFLVINIPFVFANLCDFEYYKFTGSRLTFDIFLLTNEMTNQADQFLMNFWDIGLILIFLSAVLFVLSKGSDSSSSKTPLLPSLLMSFLIIACTAIGSRGGLQKKVIQPAHAYMLGHSELGTLVLNSTFTILKSDLKPELAKATYFASKEQLKEQISIPQTKLREEKQNYNVVILILESFSTEFWGAANDYPGYTPYLDSIAKKGLFFKNNFANGRRSIEALPSILFGVPSLMSTPIAKSNYQQNRWVPLGHILRENGFHTSFFHGAKKGTMYFDAISAMAGLEDYYPLERYPSDKDFDGNWGIYDEPFLLYMVKELSTHKEPFFSVVFTISTHQPYQVPPTYKGRFPKGPLKIHESIGYVDYAVKKFFEAAEKEPWFKDTLFVITGDHTQMSASQYYNTTLGGFMVPLLLYHPGKTLEHPNLNRVTQHTDILPTVLDYVGVKEPHLTLFGRSVFDNENSGEAVLHLNGNFWLINEDQFVQYNPETDKILAFDYKSDRAQKNPLPGSNPSKKKVQAYIQYFRNGLIENNLYDWGLKKATLENKSRINK